MSRLNQVRSKLSVSSPDILEPAKYDDRNSVQPVSPPVQSAKNVRSISHEAVTTQDSLRNIKKDKVRFEISYKYLEMGIYD
jgi:hypothetical protein